MQILKKSLFYFLTVLIFLTIILIFDFLLSNTTLNYKHCIKYEEYFYELKKNCSTKYRFKKSFPLVTTHTDNMGLRVGKNYIKKNDDKENIFLFGDSFTYGVGIEYEKTFAGLLSNYFNNYNLYNFAVGSYSPTVHLYKLKKAINAKIVPSKVIIFLDLTDVIDESTRWYLDKNNKPKLRTNNLYNLSNKEEKFIDKNFKLIKNISSYINYNLRNLRANLEISTKNKYKIKTSIQGNFTYTDLKNLDTRFWKKNTFQEGIRSIEKNFKEFNNISRQNNFDIYLVLYPWAETLEFGQMKFNWSNFAKKLCNGENCIVIDAIPEFKKYKEENKNWVTDLYFLNDEHFNIKGAKLLSDIVINKFKK